MRTQTIFVTTLCILTGCAPCGQFSMDASDYTSGDGGLPFALEDGFESCGADEGSTGTWDFNGTGSVLVEVHPAHHDGELSGLITHVVATFSFPNSQLEPGAIVRPGGYAALVDSGSEYAVAFVREGEVEVLEVDEPDPEGTANRQLDVKLRWDVRWDNDVDAWYAATGTDWIGLSYPD